MSKKRSRRTSRARLLLDDGRPLVCREPVVAGEERRGFLLLDRYCGSPDCRSVHIRAVSLTFRGRDHSKPTASRLFRNSIDVSMDLDTGALTLSKRRRWLGGNPALAPRLVSALEKEGAEFRPIFEKRWRYASGTTAADWTRLDWSWWEPGVAVSWVLFQADGPNLLFTSEEEPIWADDHHCVTPGCTCGSVVVRFKQAEASSPEAVDVIHLHLRQRRATAEGGSDPLSPRQQRLWEDWQRSDRRLWRRLKRRAESLRDLGEGIQLVRDRDAASTGEGRRRRRRKGRKRKSGGA